MSEGVKELLQGKFPLLSKMSKADLLVEAEMWRNIWGWVPSAVKYYVGRTGTLVGVTIRNYKRYVGPLLDTSWELKGLEVGVYDKMFNQTDGQYYYERKIVKLPIGQIVAFDWIAQRITEEQFIADAEAEAQAKEEAQEQSEAQNRELDT